MNRHKIGLLFGFSAYILWGLFPLYWPLLEPASAIEIVSHRAIWTFVFCVIALALTNKLKATFILIKDPKIFFRFFLTTSFLSVNWLVFIWATNNSHLVEAALGYYITPLIMIAIGLLIFREKMRKLQWLSVCIATIGVGVLTFDYGRLPWVALAIAISWGAYGGLKKHINLGALEGLAIETAISTPFYALFLIWLTINGGGHFGSNIGLTSLLMAAGIITAIPLLLFNGAAIRLSYTTIGLLQFITPTLIFLIGVLVRHEAMPTARWVGFLIIWLALIALAVDLFKSSRAIDNGVAQGK